MPRDHHRTREQLDAAVEANSSETLSRIFGRGHLDEKIYLVSHPLISSHGLFLAYHFGEEEIKALVVSHRRVDRATVEKMINFGGPLVVRSFILGSSPIKMEPWVMIELRLKNKHMATVAASLDPAVAKMTGSQISSSGYARKLGYAMNDATSPELLEYLSRDGDYQIRREVARHQMTAVETLLRLSRDGDVRVREEASRLLGSGLKK